MAHMPSPTQGSRLRWLGALRLPWARRATRGTAGALTTCGARCCARALAGQTHCDAQWRTLCVAGQSLQPQHTLLCLVMWHAALQAQAAGIPQAAAGRSDRRRHWPHDEL